MKSTGPGNRWIKSAMPSASNTVPVSDLEGTHCRKSIVRLLDLMLP